MATHEFPENFLDKNQAEKQENSCAIEQHLLEIFEADTFEIAMTDDVNFNTFLSMAEELQNELVAERFGPMLMSAASATVENAEFFLEVIDDLEKIIQDKTALQQAVLSAKEKLE